ncbi:MAG: FecR domain-containing protein [Pseudomonadota bacterium]
MTTTEKQERGDALREAHAWRILIDDLDATEADRKAFEAWCAADPRHRELYDHAVTFHHALGTVEVSDLDKDVFQRTPYEYLIAFCGSVAKACAPTRVRIGVAGTALASLLLVIIVVTGVYEDTATPTERRSVARYETVIGETRTITLEDGTMIILGAASVLETVYSPSKREAVVVEGAAFFDVVSNPNRPFVVEAGDLELRVLGTEFDVNRNSEAVRVTVGEGEVEVSYRHVMNEQPTNLVSRKSLMAGQQIAASSVDGLEPIKSVHVSTVGAWREDKLFYNGAPLSELVADANRYSKARVIIEGDVDVISKYRVRGSFNARDIDGMLATLADVYPVEIDRSEPGLVRIRARPTDGR